MRKITLFVGLSTLAISIASIIACSETKTDTGKSTETGLARLALSTTGTTAGHCIQGDFVITSTTDPLLTYTIDNDDTTCSSVAPIDIPLVPGTYTITFPTAPTCVPPAALTTGYIGCTFNGTTPTAFTISGDVTTPVAINATFFYDLSTEEVVFNVGSASVTIAAPTVAELCGGLVSDPVCAVGQACYILSPGAEPGCYTTDCPTVACGIGQTCHAVALATQIGVPIVGGLAALPHICTPAVSMASPGTGGAPGAGGSSSTGGAAATGGTTGSGGAA